jgi:hypothetical protein
MYRIAKDERHGMNMKTKKKRPRANNRQQQENKESERDLKQKRISSKLRNDVPKSQSQ